MINRLRVYWERRLGMTVSGRPQMGQPPHALQQRGQVSAKRCLDLGQKNGKKDD